MMELLLVLLRAPLTGHLSWRDDSDTAEAGQSLTCVEHSINVSAYPSLLPPSDSGNLHHSVLGFPFAVKKKKKKTKSQRA